MAAAGLYPQPQYMPGDPLFSALPLASNFTAFLAAHRVMGAVLGRAQNGRGRHMEISLYEGCFQAIGYSGECPVSRILEVPFNGRLQPLMRMRKTADSSWLYFDTPMRGVQAFLDRFLPGHDLCELDDPGIEQLAEALDALIPTKTGAEWERICQGELRGSFAPSFTAAQWLEDAHALASETVITVEDGALGLTRQAGFPVRLSRSVQQVRWGRGREPARTGAIDWAGPAWEAPLPPRTGTALPLEGLRVVDCTTLLAGPTATRVLAQYGAEVIKIDGTVIGTGDTNPLTDDDVSFFGARTVQAGKRVAFLDLKHPLGQAIMRELTGGADIVHHNFTPDAARRLGVAPDQLRERNPNVIATSMSLHSHGGFREDYRGHDMLGQMISGICARLGGEGRQPRVLSIMLNDNAAGHLHAFGIMIALLRRWRTGEGQEVNSALSRTATLHQTAFMIGYEGRTWDEPAGAEALGWHALNRLYRGADGWFYLGARAGERARLEACALLAGVDTVSDEALAGWLEARFAGATVNEAVAELHGAGIAAHRHLSMPELALDPYVIDHQLMTVVDHPGLGRAHQIGLPVYGEVPPAEAPVLANHRLGSSTLDLVEETGFGHRLPELIREKVIATGEFPLLVATAKAGYWAKVNRTPGGGMTLTPGMEQRIRHGRTSVPFPLQRRED